MAERPNREMMEKSRFRETFFSVKNIAPPRPDSVLTEFMETDWEEDDILSELDDETPPRLSLDSAGGQPSMTTLSTYDEIRTPEQRSIARFEMGPDPKMPIVGPRGPHLFRSSISSANSLEYQNALSLSPITPKVPSRDVEFQMPITLDMDLETPKAYRDGPFQFTSQELDTSSLSQWSPEMVAQWMLNAGVELQFAEKFVENDINGAILITLKFEDLKELGIASFGVRTKVWEEIHVMKDIRAASPDPETPIEDEPSREVKREARRKDKPDNGGELKSRQSSRRRKPHHNEESIRPGESVSIVGIEQVMPKPHHCSKGENCRKWQRQQRMIEAFKNDHPFVNLDTGGVIMIAGDPGNPETARAIRPDDDVVFRPASDAERSVIASSDILGTEGLPPLQYLQQATLRNAQAQETRDNVRQFLELQNTTASGDMPPTPPFEMLPPRKKTPHGGLKSLSKLSIPNQVGRPVEEVPGSACPGSACPGSAYPSSAHPVNKPYQPQLPSQQRRVSLPSPSPSPDSRSHTPAGVYRFGTPFSEMDVPVTTVPMGPIPRDTSQSVPPEMNYHSASNPPPRSLSRSTFRKPSFVTMPPVDENAAATMTGSRRRIPSPITTSQTSPRSKQQRPLQPPPRVQWPWSPPSSARQFETAIAPLPKGPGSGSSSGNSSGSSTPNSSVSPGTKIGSPMGGHAKDMDAYQYQGYMRKRKLKMLRHEWHEHFVTLKGTRLAMHKDHHEIDRTLEYIDIDDYAIACSSLASTSKLNAAFKAMNIRKDKGMTKDDIAAFSFQLIPQGDMKGSSGLKLRKRESSLSGAANGTGKTHHFAVKSRDERIDWMRELMLAKALRQKGEGFEVSVNGNMI
ncbi:Protein pob1 [Cytospora mali]|uniref:Protein pob1 n=1 Tax=Cytospora mali TaxID=578113 RepID=A0A194VFS4_CYTMA|nr:Protein pob1 [Valsa mali var. pyri (nom. inval.)]